MKFDVIIGNPPYHLGLKTIYQKFIELSIKLNPRYISMIVPSRWMTTGKGLNKFREQMLIDSRLKIIIDYEESKKIFPSVNIAGGVNYFLWDSNYDGLCLYNNVLRQLNEYDIFIRGDIIVKKILNKVVSNEHQYMDKVVLSRTPFGMSTNFIKFEEEYFKDSVKLYSKLKVEKYVSKEHITKNIDLVSKYNVLISKVSGSKKIITRVKVIDKNSCCTCSLLVIDSFDNENEANNLKSFLETKLCRFLIGIVKKGLSNTKTVFKFVPVLPMTEEWTDEKLYKKYNLTKEEIKYIEENILPME